MPVDGSGENGTAEGRSAQQLLLAGIGWLSLGAEAIEELADELAHRVGVERDEMRGALQDTISSWKAEAEKLGLKRGEKTDRIVERLGLVGREELEDMSLRLAQLEHRLKLLERSAPGDEPAVTSPPHP